MMTNNDELKRAIIEAISDMPKKPMHIDDAQVIMSVIELAFKLPVTTPAVASKNPLQFVAVDCHLLPYLQMRISQIDLQKRIDICSAIANEVFRICED